MLATFFAYAYRIQNLCHYLSWTAKTNREDFHVHVTSSSSSNDSWDNFLFVVLHTKLGIVEGWVMTAHFRRF